MERRKYIPQQPLPEYVYRTCPIINCDLSRSNFAAFTREHLIVGLVVDDGDNVFPETKNKTIQRFCPRFVSTSDSEFPGEGGSIELSLTSSVLNEEEITCNSNCKHLKQLTAKQ